MKQTCSILSTYTADTMGVPSALYELGGMVVMDDPSGCNSTYNTHDEPRWYDMPSLVFISALREMDALLGDDRKIIDSVTSAAKEFHPRFIAVCGAPIPMMVGTDFDALALCIEKESGIPSFGFKTNGLHSYISGVSSALCAIAGRFCPSDGPAAFSDKKDGISVNLLGVTPLDFSITGNVAAMEQTFIRNNIAVRSIWAMQSSWEALMHSGSVSVNVVVSRCGLELAGQLKKKYGTPYITGLPVGKTGTERVMELVRKAAATGENQQPVHAPSGGSTFVVGEMTAAQAVADEVFQLSGKPVTVIDPIDTVDEDFLMQTLSDAEVVIGDPFYQAVVKKGCRFIDWPHEAYSGRIYRDRIPLIMGDAGTAWLEKELS
jgi:nitrogenase molybdenum-iron protein alpha/beta subunit